MPTDQRKPRGGRDEYEVAWYTKELGRSLQRKLLQQRLDGLSESRAITAQHGEEVPSQPADATEPPEHRAG